MTPKAIDVQLEVPDTVSDQLKELARTRAHEAAVLALWEASCLSIREAAEELDLTYRGFLDLLAAKGIPIERGSVDQKVLDEARRKSGIGPP